MRQASATVALMAACLIVAAGPAVAQEASLVGVDSVRSEPLRQTAPVVGRFVACQGGEVTARVAGAVGEIAVEVGDRVNEGDVLAVLARERFAAELALRSTQVAEAEAVANSTQSKLALRRQELDRLSRLRRSPAFSEGQFVDKQLEVAMTEAELAETQALVARASAEQRLAEIDYRDTEIRAPYAGAVSRRHTEVGAFVNPGSAVVSLINADCLEIEADVPQVRARTLDPGTPVTYGPDLTPATVRAVLPEENPLTRTRTVRFTPDVDPQSGPVSGQSITLWLPIGGARDVLTVHKDAVVSRRGQQTVFAVEDGEAVPRPVTLGEAVGSRFEVLDGLDDGDIVVVRGNERLRPGQAVRFNGGAAPEAGG
jgi:RND family efflux transporter MFP subunit